MFIRVCSCEEGRGYRNFNGFLALQLTLVATWICGEKLLAGPALGGKHISSLTYKTRHLSQPTDGVPALTFMIFHLPA